VPIMGPAADGKEDSSHRHRPRIRDQIFDRNFPAVGPPTGSGGVRNEFQ